eukprot:Skav209416  [mRNA]  locus=scaffold1411:186413:189705:+ [translate_table: standard]
MPSWRPHVCCRALSSSSVQRVQALAAKYAPDWQLRFTPDDLEGDLVRHVMSIYEFTSFASNHQAALGQIMHGLAHSIRRHWGPYWAEDIGLVSWSIAERHDHMSMFKKLRVFLVVLHSENHWALMVVLRNKNWAVVFDGQANQHIFEASETMSVYFEQQFGHKIKVQYARVPPQMDSWSCGHRCVLCAEHVLNCLRKTGWLEIPLSIPAKAVSEAKFQQLTMMEPFLPPSCLAQKIEQTDCRPETKPAPKRKIQAVSKNPKQKEKETEEKPKKKSKASELAELKELEIKLQHEMNFSHNIEFQKEHKKHNVYPRKGHWQEFLKLFRDDSPMSRVACQRCRQLAKGEELSSPPSASPEKSPEPEPVCDEDKKPEVEGRKRGRPKKGSDGWEGLSHWLEKNRTGIYQPLDAESRAWLCRLCNQELRLQRDGTTFVLLHERRELHKDKLKLFNNGLISFKGIDEERIGPCTGANIAADELLVPDLFAARESVHNWILGGMPLVTGDGPLQEAVFHFTGNKLMFKSSKCAGSDSKGLCGKCFHLSRNSALVREVKRWSWRLDQIQLAHLLMMGTQEETRDHQESICKRDYFDAEVHGRELKMLMSRSIPDAIGHIRQSILAIHKGKRNASLQGIIDTRLVDIKDITPKNLEKSMFQTLVRKYMGAVERGECHKDEFRMASLVASGKMASEPLVNALFKSALHKISRVENGSIRPCTSKYVNPEMALEMLVILGKSTHSENFLQLLGVNPRVLPRIDFQSELVPQPFTASRSRDILEANIKCSLRLLGLSPGSRGFQVLCDETTWHATLDLVSGLRQDSYGYVGGYYASDPAADRSFLTLEQMRESNDKDLARLTQHYLITRTDTNTHVWSVDVVPRPTKAAELGVHGAEHTFVEMGNCLAAVCAANDNVPPATVAFDAGSAHALINRALMGLLSSEKLAGAPFWKECKVQRVKLPAFAFGVIVYDNKWPVLGCLDPGHVFKRLAYHLGTGARYMARIGKICQDIFWIFWIFLG